MKDAIWDCLFRYSMVLTSFSLSSSFLFTASCKEQQHTCPNEALAQGLLFIMDFRGKGKGELGEQEDSREQTRTVGLFEDT